MTLSSISLGTLTCPSLVFSYQSQQPLSVPLKRSIVQIPSFRIVTMISWPPAHPILHLVLVSYSVMWEASDPSSTSFQPKLPQISWCVITMRMFTSLLGWSIGRASSCTTKTSGRVCWPVWSHQPGSNPSCCRYFSRLLLAWMKVT